METREAITEKVTLKKGGLAMARPIEIIELEGKIKEESVAANNSARIRGSLDYERLRKIAQMRSELETLYFNWAQTNA